MNQLPLAARIRIAAALVDGNSIRATERQTGHHRDSVMRFGVELGEACGRLHDALVRDVQAPLIECDEIWTFVGKKRRQTTPSDGPEVGDQYVYIALAATSKLILSYRVGKRNAVVTQAFTDDLRSRVLGAPQISTDALPLYRNAIEASFGPDVHFAQVEKHYETPQSPEAARRYSPGRIISQDRKVVTGNPKWDRISTSYVERQNLTMRMSMRRFTRLTSGFSKRLRNLEAAVALYVAYYNLCRVHETLRVTPAMQARLTDHVWSIAELLTAALDMPPAPVAPIAPEPEPEPIAVGLSAKQAGTLHRRTLHRRGLRIVKGGLAR
jgi:IS1 family transposase